MSLPPRVNYILSLPSLGLNDHNHTIVNSFIQNQILADSILRYSDTSKKFEKPAYEAPFYLSDLKREDIIQDVSNAIKKQNIKYVIVSLGLRTRPRVYGFTEKPGYKIGFRVVINAPEGYCPDFSGPSTIQEIVDMMYVGLLVQEVNTL